MQSSVANRWSDGSLQDKIMYLLIHKTNTNNMKCNATTIERRNTLIQRNKPNPYLECGEHGLSVSCFSSFDTGGLLSVECEGK